MSLVGPRDVNQLCDPGEVPLEVSTPILSFDNCIVLFAVSPIIASIRYGAVREPPVELQ